VIVAREIFTMTSDQARQRAEKSFKREERARDGRKAMTEYEAQARATREKTERLKALRLAREAQAQTRGAARQADQSAPPRAATNNSSLSVQARQQCLRPKLSPATHVRGAFFLDVTSVQMQSEVRPLVDRERTTHSAI